VKFGFYSCMNGMPWGGSEVLWQLAAKRLQDEKHEVTANFKWWPYKAHQLEQLEKRGGTVWRRGEPKKRFLKRKKLYYRGRANVNRGSKKNGLTRC